MTFENDVNAYYLTIEIMMFYKRCEYLYLKPQ